MGKENSESFAYNRLKAKITYIFDQLFEYLI